MARQIRCLPVNLCSESLGKGRVGGRGGPLTKDGLKARLRRWREETRGSVPADRSVGSRCLSEGVRSLRTGGLGEESGHSPQWDRIFSITSGWLSSMCSTGCA